MQLEKGDFFVVINGTEIGAVILGINPAQMMAAMQQGEPPQGDMDVKPKYDKSHEGIIYKVLEMTPGSQVAAVEVIYDSFGPILRGESYTGKRFSLNVEELNETMTVTQNYVNELRSAWDQEQKARAEEEKAARELLKNFYMQRLMPQQGNQMPPVSFQPLSAPLPSQLSPLPEDVLPEEPLDDMPLDDIPLVPPTNLFFDRYMTDFNTDINNVPPIDPIDPIDPDIEGTGLDDPLI